jgi:NAD(P)-dependent dehydrogenase (short-subunit alcohol dehydrogenase family)
MLINNAGTPGKGSSFLSTVPDQLYAEFGVHCVGPLLATQACAKYFEPGSIIVNITSRLGSIGRTSAGEFSTIETSYSYRIAKAAQNMLSLCFTQDPALTGVIVCGLHPGRIKSGCGRSDAPTEPAEAANRYMRWSESISKEMHGRCYDLNAGEMLW